MAEKLTNGLNKMNVEQKEEVLLINLRKLLPKKHK